MPFADARIDVSDEEIDEFTHLVTVSGEVHVTTAPTLSSCINGALTSGKTALVIDLSGVEFIDSTGLSVLLNALRRVTRRQGRLVLVCQNPTVLRLFEITRLDTTFDIRRNLREALSRVRAA